MANCSREGCLQRCKPASGLRPIPTQIVKLEMRRAIVRPRLPPSLKTSQEGRPRVRGTNLRSLNPATDCRCAIDTTVAQRRTLFYDLIKMRYRLRIETRRCLIEEQGYRLGRLTYPGVRLTGVAGTIPPLLGSQRAPAREDRLAGKMLSLPGPSWGAWPRPPYSLFLTNYNHVF
jgi:hypothetical protein